MFSHMYFICGSLVAASIAAPRRRPFRALQAENNGAYLFPGIYGLSLVPTAMLVIVFSALVTTGNG